MNKPNLKLTLRWRIALLTSLVMLLSSIVIVTFQILNTSRIMPALSSEILDTINSKGNVISATDSSSALLAGSAPGSTQSDTGAVIIATAVQDGTFAMYRGLVLIFLVTITLGGVGAYFIAGRAMRPVKEFSEKIRDVNANNLTQALPTEGPQDEIKELALSFNSMLSRLDNAFSSQKRFNASVAHELKTPLAVVQANIDALSSQEPNATEVRRVLTLVEQSTHKMNTIVDALLETVQQENAAMDDCVNVSDILSDVVEDAQHFAEKGGIRLDCNLEFVSGRSGSQILLYRAFYNLVDNAIKYTRPQGEVHISCLERNRCIEIDVSDTGIGFTEEQAAHIFEPFYRVNKKIPQEGLGLGLSLVKSVIAMHRGEVIVSSVPDQGTTFRINLPL